jgi:hypothetical protein
VAACEIVFGEVVELHAVVVAEGPHEATRRRHEVALMEANEADEDQVWFEDRWMVASLCDE